MDEGAEAAWEWAYAFADDPLVEISAIQRGYNVLIDDGPKVFDLQVQNKPTRITSLAEKRLLSVRGFVRSSELMAGVVHRRPTRSRPGSISRSGPCTGPCAGLETSSPGGRSRMGCFPSNRSWAV